MKRLALLLVLVVAFILGAGPLSDVSLPFYVPTSLCRARIVSEFEWRNRRFEIHKPVYLQPGILLSEFVPMMNTKALMVRAHVTPDTTEGQATWTPPNIPDPEGVLKTLVQRASKSFEVAPENLVVIASGESRDAQGIMRSFLFAIWMRGKSQFPPPGADGMLQGRMVEDARHASEGR